MMPTMNAPASANPLVDDTPRLADFRTSTFNATSGSAASEAWLSVVGALRDVSLGRILYATVIKRAVDIVAASLLLLCFSPLILLAAIAVVLDSSGPAWFIQHRVGRNGQLFRLYKLRTMGHASTEPSIWILDDNGNVCHKRKNDPRVTRVGRWLRRTSVDELPQLINILKGDMSLIGPRPELPEIVQRYAGWQHGRHLVRPGLTGWWQVMGRSDKPMHENTELDLFYVERQSLRLDLLIALKTIRVVFCGRGAF